MKGYMRQELFTLVEKFPFRQRRLIKRDQEVEVRVKADGYDVKIVGGNLDGYTFELTEREYYHYIGR